MEEIPQLPFKKKRKNRLEFEIFPLSSLFARRDRLNHQIDQPHRLTFFNIMFISEGSGHHTVDFEQYRFETGSILFISKGQTQAFDPSLDYDGHMILFTEPFLSKNLIQADILSIYRLYNYHLQKPIIQPNQIGIGVFKNLVQEMEKEYNYADNFAKEEILRLLLKLFLLKAERIKRTLIPHEQNSDRFLEFATFQTLLEKRISETRSAKSYAEMMHISYKHLNEICKSVTGKTAKEIIDNYLILEIKRQLAISDISIKELTYTLGFDEPTNFVKYFKRHSGLSPAQFRKGLGE